MLRVAISPYCMSIEKEFFRIMQEKEKMRARELEVRQNRDNKIVYTPMRAISPPSSITVCSGNLP